MLDAPVRAVMGPGFPTVKIDGSFGDVVHMMSSRKTPAVLVEGEDHAIRSILTRDDVLEFLKE